MSEKTVYATVKIRLVPPDDSVATNDEIREAIESAIADLVEFGVDVRLSEDGEEYWNVDEATTITLDKL